MLVNRESFATILLANSSFKVSALVSSWSCRPSSACLKACWETNEASEGELGRELSSHSSGCSKLALVSWKKVTTLTNGLLFGVKKWFELILCCNDFNFTIYSLVSKSVSIYILLWEHVIASKISVSGS